eukprot:1552008-Pyramimonas_sp.AAC.1
MVSNVRAADAVVEEVQEGTVGAIYCAQCPLDEVPLALIVVRDVDVSVLQPCVQYQPEVDTDVRQAVQESNLRGSTDRGPVPEACHRGHDPHVRGVHLALPLAREQLVLALVTHEGHEVVGFATHRPAGDARQQVGRPAEAKVGNQAEHTVQGRPHDLLAPLAGGAFITHDLGHVGLALGQVVGLGVMHGMAPLPGEVGHKQQRVQNVPNSILEGFVVRERAVSTLVRHDPAAGGDGAVDKSVGDPGGPVGRGHGDAEVGQGTAANGQCRGDRGIHQRLGRVPLEALRGNRVEHLRLGGPGLDG